MSQIKVNLHFFYNCTNVLQDFDKELAVSLLHVRVLLLGKFCFIFTEHSIIVLSAFHISLKIAISTREAATATTTTTTTTTTAIIQLNLGP